MPHARRGGQTVAMRVRWERDLHHAPNEWTVLSADRVLVPERESKLARLEPSTGDLTWVCDVGTAWGWLCVAGHAAVYLNKSGQLQCIEVTDGQPRWCRQFQEPGLYWGALLPLDDTTALVGGWRGYTDRRCVSRIDGSDVWRQHVRQPTTGLPILTDYGIAVVHPSQVEIIDPITGIPERTLPFPKREVDVDDQMITADRSHLFCCDGRRILGLALDEDRDWTEIGCLPERIESRRYGRVHLIDRDGSIEQQATVTQRISSALSLGPPDTILFTTKGTVMALDIAHTA
ncbi:MAG: outer membrane protein assembly factor BamB [Solirubrobacteraceae bacterium]|nr:outer membrane protein assembly factor BamB [Solirubrobacteraceae bacterium]